jgi:hypothetical protein
MESFIAEAFVQEMMRLLTDAATRWQNRTGLRKRSSPAMLPTWVCVKLDMLCRTFADVKSQVEDKQLYEEVFE